MISELVFTALLSIVSIQLDSSESIDEKDHVFNDCSETYRVSDNTFLTFFYPHYSQ